MQRKQVYKSMNALNGSYTYDQNGRLVKIIGYDWADCDIVAEYWADDGNLSTSRIPVDALLVEWDPPDLPYLGEQSLNGVSPARLEPE